MDNHPVYHDPPKRMMQVIRWFCKEGFLEEIEGDLFELFQEEVEEHGLRKANWRFLIMAIRYLRPYFFGKKIFSPDLEYYFTMLKHYLKISTRNLVKQRFYSLINISGFAIGLTACLLIALFIRSEIGYDQFHPESDSIYRLYFDAKIGERSGKGAVVTTPVAQTMLEEYPEIVQAARIAPEMYEAGNNQVRRVDREQSIYEEGFVYADPSFMEIFQFPMIQGDLSALDEPFSMVLTERKAKQFFGNEDPIGQFFILNNDEEQPFKVAGIMKDLPTNTHLQFDYLLSMEGLRVSKIPNWGFSNFVTYFKLAPNADPKELEAKFPGFLKKYEREDRYERFSQAGNHFHYKLQPVSDIHLHSSDIQAYWKHSDAQYIWLFGIIALIILLIACINFMNLSTARSANRSKEVGVRKVLGSSKQNLFMQFLVESLLVSFLAFLLALTLSTHLLPYFNQLTGKELTFPWSDVWLLASLFGGVFLIGIFSGIYPSIFLSSFRPVQVLNGKLSQGSKRGGMRSTLVIIQFTTSIALIIGSLVVQKQLNYIQNKKLGFDKEQVLIIEDSHTLGRKITTFKEELKGLNEVSEVSVTGYIPVGGYNRNGSGIWVEGSDPEKSELGMAKWYVDHDYIKTLGMNIIEGRDFDIQRPTDSSAVILSQTGIKKLGLKDPIGKRVNSYTYLDPETGELLFDTYTIIGIVEDFHFQSLKENIEGISLVIGRSRGNVMVKAKGAEMQTLISDVEETWNEFSPNQSFRYSFLDEQFAQMYAMEDRAGNIFVIFTGLAIFVACLGLFALATFMAEQRSKEISIRKVLGANTFDLVYLMTKNFGVLVLISLLIACPLAFYFMDDWLADFSYQTTIGWQVFALAGGAAFGIALLSCGYQALKAALMNPVEAIKSE